MWLILSSVSSSTTARFPSLALQRASLVSPVADFSSALSVDSYFSSIIRIFPLSSTFPRSFYTFEACQIPTYYPPVLFSPRPETLSSGLEENTSFIFIRTCTFIELILFEQNMVYKIKPVSSFCSALSLIFCPSLYYLCEMSSVSLPCNLSFFSPDGSSLLRKVKHLSPDVV